MFFRSTIRVENARPTRNRKIISVYPRALVAYSAMAEENPEEPIPFDWHAGEGETSSMLYLAPSLVDMSEAEKPVLTFPPIVQKTLENAETEPNLGLVQEANLFRPKDSEKMASSREISSNGVFTSGDPKNATAERGRKSKERQIQAAVQFIEAWKKVSW